MWKSYDNTDTDLSNGLGFSLCYTGRGRGRGNRASARCYACGQIGHYQNFCPYKGAPAAKRGKFVPGLQDQSKN